MVLAPSAHNTQPWRFTAQSNQIDIYVDWDRHLPISDPTHRQLLVSIGCAIANAKVAAHYWGYEAEVTYFPAGQTNDAPVAQLILKSSRSKNQLSLAELFSAIEARRTDRALYDSQPLTDAERAAITKDADSSVLLLENNSAIKQIAALTEEATVKTLSRDDFREELSHWVRSNWSDRPDGMPGYAMGMPPPVSLVSSFIVRHMPIHKQEGPKTRQQISSSSVVAIIATDSESPADSLRAGEALETLWLRATAAGLAVAPLVATVEAGEPIRQRLMRIANTKKYPQSVLRIGHGSAVPLRATPRRNVEDCLI